MSIQIGQPGNAESRKEVVARVGELLASHAAALGQDSAPEGMESDTAAKFREEAKSFFHALVGSWPTSDEVSAMGAQ